MAQLTKDPIQYTEDVERKQPNEDKDTAEALASFGRMRAKTFEKYRHAVRDAHAKSHGILKGELAVYPLPELLAQGVFCTPRTFPVMARYSTSPGEILPDGLSAFRGLAIKLLGVEGQKVLSEQTNAQTQDFLFENHPVFPVADVSGYLKQSLLLEALTSQPEELQKAMADVARTAGSALRRVGLDPAGNVGGQAKPETHILGETYYTMAALRYGEYLAKLSLVPVSPNLQPLRGLRVDTQEPSALRDLIVNFFRENTAEYELCAQLCTDLTTMPIENASVRWPEDQSPYVPIARLTFPRQEAYSPARRVYGDDVLSFNSWHCLLEHRPLGSLMRLRRQAYEASSQYRHAMNAQPRTEPRSLAEMPD